VPDVRYFGTYSRNFNSTDPIIPTDRGIGKSGPDRSISSFVLQIEPIHLGIGGGASEKVRIHPRDEA
jgi:hypothetical protein